MKRLTYFDGEFWVHKNFPPVEENRVDEFIDCVKELAARLAAIEDILGDEYDLDRLRELAQADREGRCVVLPCKVGDKLYEAIRHRNSGEMEVVERIVQSIEFFADSYYVKMYRWKPCKETNGVLSQRVDSWAKETDIGKTVFLIRKEAEAALRREQDGE